MPHGLLLSINSKGSFICTIPTYRITHTTTFVTQVMEHWLEREIAQRVHLQLRKEGNVLFNDALNTFYLRLYGVRHMVKYHSDSERKPAAATWATLSN